jgi:hypothetical protein
MKYTGKGFSFTRKMSYMSVYKSTNQRLNSRTVTDSNLPSTKPPHFTIRLQHMQLVATHATTFENMKKERTRFHKWSLTLSDVCLIQKI